jgi:hypothetical protein
VSSPSERRQRAEASHAEAVRLDVAAEKGGGRRRRLLCRATAALVDVDEQLKALRDLGYEERPDGSWITPDGRILRLAK